MLVAAMPSYLSEAARTSFRSISMVANCFSRRSSRWGCCNCSVKDVAEKAAGEIEAIVEVSTSSCLIEGACS